jgi:Tfp pilus assembly protein FimT
MMNAAPPSALRPPRATGAAGVARRSRLADQLGMTFSEVTTSLVLLAGIVAIIGPVFTQLLGIYHLRGATQEIFAELQRARLAAVMENHRFRLSVIDGTGTYDVHDDRNNDGVEDEGEVTSRGVDIDNPGIVLSGEQAGVTFLPNGTALTYGTITISHSNGRVKSVVVSSGGRIRTQ